MVATGHIGKAYRQLILICLGVILLFILGITGLFFTSGWLWTVSLIITLFFGIIIGNFGLVVSQILKPKKTYTDDDYLGL